MGDDSCIHIGGSLLLLIFVVVDDVEVEAIGGSRLVWGREERWAALSSSMLLLRALS